MNQPCYHKFPNILNYYTTIQPRQSASQSSPQIVRLSRGNRKGKVRTPTLTRYVNNSGGGKPPYLILGYTLPEYRQVLKVTGWRLQALAMWLAYGNLVSNPCVAFTFAFPCKTFVGAHRPMPISGHQLSTGVTKTPRPTDKLVIADRRYGLLSLLLF